MSDTRIAYGARCTWWGHIREVGHRTVSGDHPLPCCPHCRGMLFEMDNEGQWFSGADRYEASGHPGYRKMLEWSRGKCFPNLGALETAYRAETP